mmetsp:Transcript_42682/g.113035  ORF Transcript_42682/g.113035 Transcript_42682/m.113035 type:complete len:242 (+) Transcript_42682:31-756(+)
MMPMETSVMPTSARPAMRAAAPMTKTDMPIMVISGAYARSPARTIGSSSFLNKNGIFRCTLTSCELPATATRSSLLENFWITKPSPSQVLRQRRFSFIFTFFLLKQGSALLIMLMSPASSAAVDTRTLTFGALKDTSFGTNGARNLRKTGGSPAGLITMHRPSLLVYTPCTGQCCKALSPMAPPIFSMLLLLFSATRANDVMATTPITEPMRSPAVRSVIETLALGAVVCSPNAETAATWM